MRPTFFPARSKYTALSSAVALAGILCLPAAVQAASTAEQPEGQAFQLAQAGPQGKAQGYGPEANPGLVFKETRGKSALKSKGMTVRKLRGRAAGKPLSSMPGAKAITRGRWAQMKEIPKTGLYLVDMDFVPPGLEQDLKQNGYRLAKDGTLTKNGNPVALFVHGETFHVKPEKPGGGGGGGAFLQIDPLKQPVRFAQGLAEQVGNTLARLVNAAGSLVIDEARAASPFPWRCGTWYFKWEYNGGFCRDYRAWSHAYAWGPGSDGVCANPKPLTRIEYISTYAKAGSKTDWDYHYNADQSHSYAKHDIGCFWPAHGGASGYHYAYWRDGGAWMYRTWSWAH